MFTLLKQCKLCPSITEDARYVPAILGWKCKECEDNDLATTGKFDVAELRRQATPVDYNLIDSDEDAAFIIETREILGADHSDTMRRHHRHLEELS